MAKLKCQHYSSFQCHIILFDLVVKKRILVYLSIINVDNGYAA